MAEYGEDIQSLLNEFKNDLPDKFKWNIDVREALLDKETARSKYIFGILENSLAVLNNPSDTKAKSSLRGVVERTLQSFTESGGAGVEALTRLQALGVIDEIPKITFLSGSTAELREDFNIKVDSSAKAIEILVYFDAHVPDNTGKETWREEAAQFSGGSLCFARIRIQISNTAEVKSYLEDLHKYYHELMKIKYPDEMVD